MCEEKRESQEHHATASAQHGVTEVIERTCHWCGQKMMIISICEPYRTLVCSDEDCPATGIEGRMPGGEWPSDRALYMKYYRDEVFSNDSIDSGIKF